MRKIADFPNALREISIYYNYNRREKSYERCQRTENC